MRKKTNILKQAWKRFNKTNAKANDLYTRADWLEDEADKLRAKADKLENKADLTNMKANGLEDDAEHKWTEAIWSVRGNRDVSIERVWRKEKNAYAHIVGKDSLEGEEIFEPLKIKVKEKK